MGLVVHRRLAIPLSAIAFFTLALTAPTAATLLLMPATTLFAIAAVGIAAIVLLMPGAMQSWRASRSLVRVLPSGHRDQAGPGIEMTAVICVRTLEEPNQSVADDALDLVRLEDDGGWEIARPRA